MLMLSPVILFLLGARRMPAANWRLALCSLPWLGLHLFASIWYEVRYYMPVLIWLMPGLVHAMHIRSDSPPRTLT